MPLHQKLASIARSLALLALCSLTAGCLAPPVGAVLEYEVDEDAAIDMPRLLKAIDSRLNGAGKSRATDRDRFAVDVYGTPDEEALDALNRLLVTQGLLEFRITASRNFNRHQNAILRGEALEPSEVVVKAGDREIGRWVEFDATEFGDVEQARARGLVTRLSGKVPQALVLTDDGVNVTSKYLRSATAGVDDMGRPQVEFKFNSQGAFRFGQLTGNNLPNPSGERYALGIIFDGLLLSAPTIESRIKDSGTISGGSMTQDEVDSIIAVLNAGALPYPIRSVALPANPLKK